MGFPHSTLGDEQFATQASVASDIARLAPIQLGSIPKAAILLLTALARHDGNIYAHSLRVGRLAWSLSLMLDDDQEQARALFLAGLLHDIGKINLPRSLLQKPAPLTATEWAMVKLYPHKGAQLIQHQIELAALAPIIASHQERPDGMGYPNGLFLPSIPIGALRIAVADATDAMGTQRPYAAAMPVQEICEELWAGAGTCWDHTTALTVAQELSQRNQAVLSPWMAIPRMLTPATVLSE